MWQGIRNITDYKQSYNTPKPTDTFFFPELDKFLARFEDTEPSESDHPLTLLSYPVQQALYDINGDEATGSDAVPGHVFNVCTHQLAEVFLLTSSTAPYDKLQFTPARKP